MMKSTVLFLLCGAVLAAQQTPVVVEDRNQVFVTSRAFAGGGGGAMVTAGSGMEMKWFAENLGSDQKVVTGAPYSASAVTETVQTLADGNHIRHTTTSSIARDSQGRTRREQSMSGLASLAGNAQLPTLVFLQDPVAKTHYVLEPDSKIARSTPAGAMSGPAPDAYQIKVIGKAAYKDGPDFKKESLGSQVINGVRADGTRITHTIAAGEMGNEKPIDIVTETWYSPDLQATVRSKSSDPRIGDTTFELQNIDRSEPAASLFTVPADYTVQESHGAITVMRDHE
jgi:hypothetical protein